MTNHPDNSAQKHSPSFVPPAFDQHFLMSDAMRGVRFLLEYEKAEETLRQWGVATTVVVFGSARVKPGEPHYEQAREIGRIISERGGALLSNGGPRQHVIATGGGPGIMEAANRGAAEVGAPNIGFNITLPHEQEPNAYTTPELTFLFHYFAMRKMHLAMRAAALVVFPGGFGTFDELFEILTLRQTGKMNSIPVVLFDRSYWEKVINWQEIAKAGMIAEKDLEIFEFADEPEEAWASLTRRGLAAIPAFQHVTEGDR